MAKGTGRKGTGKAAASRHTHRQRSPGPGGAGPGPLPGAVDLECRRCDLWKTRTRVVPGTGDRSARLCLVGEAPGRFEDEGGEPFIGRAGALLDDALRSAGTDRDRVFITNLVKCRPPKNRNPTGVEAAACCPQLESELEALDPAVVCFLGLVPSGWALGLIGEKARSMGGAAGRELTLRLGGKERSVILSYHPAACIYNRKLVPELERILEHAVREAGP